MKLTEESEMELASEEVASVNKLPEARQKQFITSSLPDANDATSNVHIHVINGHNGTSCDSTRTFHNGEVVDNSEPDIMGVEVESYSLVKPPLVRCENGNSGSFQNSIIKDNGTSHIQCDNLNSFCDKRLSEKQSTLNYSAESDELNLKLSDDEEEETEGCHNKNFVSVPKNVEVKSGLIETVDSDGNNTDKGSGEKEDFKMMTNSHSDPEPSTKFESIPAHCDEFQGNIMKESKEIQHQSSAAETTNIVDVKECEDKSSVFDFVRDVKGDCASSEGIPVSFASSEGKPVSLLSHGMDQEGERDEMCNYSAVDCKDNQTNSLVESRAPVSSSPIKSTESPRLGMNTDTSLYPPMKADTILYENRDQVLDCTPTSEANTKFDNVVQLKKREPLLDSKPLSVDADSSNVISDISGGTKKECRAGDQKSKHEAEMKLSTGGVKSDLKKLEANIIETVNDEYSPQSEDVNDSCVKPMEEHRKEICTEERSSTREGKPILNEVENDVKEDPENSCVDPMEEHMKEFDTEMRLPTCEENLSMNVLGDNNMETAKAKYSPQTEDQEVSCVKLVDEHMKEIDTEFEFPSSDGNTIVNEIEDEKMETGNSKDSPQQEDKDVSCFKPVEVSMNEVGSLSSEECTKISAVEDMKVGTATAEYSSQLVNPEVSSVKSVKEHIKEIETEIRFPSSEINLKISEVEDIKLETSNAEYSSQQANPDVSCVKPMEEPMKDIDTGVTYTSSEGKLKSSELEVINMETSNAKYSPQQADPDVPCVKPMEEPMKDIDTEVTLSSSEGKLKISELEDINMEISNAEYSPQQADSDVSCVEPMEEPMRDIDTEVTLSSSEGKLKISELEDINMETADAEYSPHLVNTEVSSVKPVKEHMVEMDTEMRFPSSEENSKVREVENIKMETSNAENSPQSVDPEVLCVKLAEEKVKEIDSEINFSTREEKPKINEAEVNKMEISKAKYSPQPVDFEVSCVKSRDEHMKEIDMERKPKLNEIEGIKIETATAEYSPQPEKPEVSCFKLVEEHMKEVSEELCKEANETSEEQSCTLNETNVLSIKAESTPSALVGGEDAKTYVSGTDLLSAIVRCEDTRTSVINNDIKSQTVENDVLCQELKEESFPSEVEKCDARDVSPLSENNEDITQSNVLMDKNLSFKQSLSINIGKSSDSSDEPERDDETKDKLYSHKGIKRNDSDVGTSVNLPLSASCEKEIVFEETVQREKENDISTSLRSLENAEGLTEETSHSETKSDDRSTIIENNESSRPQEDNDNICRKRTHSRVDDIWDSAKKKINGLPEEECILPTKSLEEKSSDSGQKRPADSKTEVEAKKIRVGSKYEQSSETSNKPKAKDELNSKVHSVENDKSWNRLKDTNLESLLSEPPPLPETNLDISIQRVIDRAAMPPAKPLDLPYLKKLYKGELERISRNDLEELVVQKICEAICERSVVGELRLRCQALEKGQEKEREKFNSLRKQMQELNMVLRRYLDSQKSGTPTPLIKVTRSVGLQVCQGVKSTGNPYVCSRGRGNQTQSPVRSQRQQGPTPPSNKSKVAASPRQDAAVTKSPQSQANCVVIPRTPPGSGNRMARPISAMQPTSNPPALVPTSTPTAVLLTMPTSVPTIASRNAATPPRAQPQIPPLHQIAGSRPRLSTPSTISTSVNSNAMQTQARQPPSLQVRQNSPQSPSVIRPAAPAGDVEVIDVIDKEDSNKRPVVRTSQQQQQQQQPPPPQQQHHQMQHQHQKQAANAAAQNLASNSGMTVRLISPSQVPQPGVTYHQLLVPSHGMQQQKMIITSASQGNALRGNVKTFIMKGSNQGNVLIPIQSGNVGVAVSSSMMHMPSQTTQQAVQQIFTNAHSGVRTSTVATVKPQQLNHPAPLPPGPPTQSSNPGWKMLPPKPNLKIQHQNNGIVLSWNMVIGSTYAEIASYQLYAYQEGSAPPNPSLWKKVGDVKALPLPMACTLTQFVAGHRYHFTVRAVDVHGRVGPFSQQGSIRLGN